MQVKNQQLELDMEKQTGSKLGKEYVKAVYCHPAYLTYIQSTSCEMLGWMKHKLESRLLGEISITSDMQMTPPLWQSEEELKSLLMEVKEEVLVVRLCLTLCDPMHYSPPGSSVRGILQARILECGASPFSRGSSRPRDQTQVSCISGRFFTI